jgi:hypothetical protein
VSRIARTVIVVSLKPIARPPTERGLRIEPSNNSFAPVSFRAHFTGHGFHGQTRSPQPCRMVGDDG